MNRPTVTIPEIMRIMSACKEALPGLLLLASLACADSTTPGDPDRIPGSHWVLALVQTPRGTFDATRLAQRPNITFGLPEGSATLPVSGFGGCNTFGGRVSLTAAGIVFEQLVSTEMFCPGPGSDMEAEYFAVLGAASTYDTGPQELIVETDSGSRLRFEALSQ